MSSENKLDQVENLRVAGNQYFQKKMYNNAIDCYSRALQMRLDPLVLGNRAQAYLNLKKYEKAYMDAHAAVKIDPKFVKGIYRKALALHELGLNSRAKLDLDRILELESSNKQAKELLEKIKDLSDAPSIEVQTFNKSETLQSKNTFRIVPISSISHQVTQGIADLTVSEPEIMEIDQPKPQTSTGLPKVQPISLPDPPRLAYEFMRAYMELKEDAERFAEYFLTIDFTLYDQLFGETMDADLIPLLVRGILQRSERTERVLNALLQLANVKRFEINVLFLEEATKKALLQLFDEFGEEYETLVNSIKQLYGF